jgi:hypothetical protein
MTRALSTLMILSSLTVSEAFAAKWVCTPNPAACPSGNHILCIGHGWCGPQNCEFCQSDGSTPKRYFDAHASNTFIVEESARYSPWSDDDECSAARHAVERKASTLCLGQSVRRVSEFTENYGVGGPLMCQASAQFVCEG